MSVRFHVSVFIIHLTPFVVSLNRPSCTVKLHSVSLGRITVRGVGRGEGAAAPLPQSKKKRKERMARKTERKKKEKKGIKRGRKLNQLFKEHVFMGR